MFSECSTFSTFPFVRVQVCVVKLVFNERVHISVQERKLHQSQSSQTALLTRTVRGTKKNQIQRKQSLQGKEKIGRKMVWPHSKKGARKVYKSSQAPSTQRPAPSSQQPAASRQRPAASSSKPPADSTLCRGEFGSDLACPLWSIAICGLLLAAAACCCWLCCWLLAVLLAPSCTACCCAACCLLLAAVAGAGWCLLLVAAIAAARCRWLLLLLLLLPLLLLLLLLPLLMLPLVAVAAACCCCCCCCCCWLLLLPPCCATAGCTIERGCGTYHEMSGMRGDGPSAHCQLLSHKSCCIQHVPLLKLHSHHQFHRRQGRPALAKPLHPPLLVPKPRAFFITFCNKRTAEKNLPPPCPASLSAERFRAALFALGCTFLSLHRTHTHTHT